MTLKDFSAGGIFKLAPNGYMAAVLRDGKPHTNAGRMSVECVISTQDEDRSGDLVITKGIDLSDHRRNPVALLNHDKDAPIGSFEDRLGNYTVKLRGDTQLVGEIFFHQNSALACDVFRAIENKVFRGVSIGFMPVLGKIEKRHERGHIYHASKMVEGSILSIGDNQNAIIEAVHKGFSGKPICEPLLSILRQQIPTELPEFVTSGWDVGAIAKGGTYKMAEPKEVEPQTRSSVFYTCPHCNCEMTHESIFKDDDGTTRHGPCRGAVVLKDATPATDTTSPIVGSAPVTKDDSKIVTPISQALFPSKAFNPTPRFLPGLMRIKAMQDEYEDTAMGGSMDDGMEDEFMPTDDDEMDGPAMKGGAEAHHGINDILMQAMQFIEDAGGTVDNATAKKTLEKVSKWLGKALAALHDGHKAYLGEHPDQPALPGGAGVGSDSGDPDEDDLDDDESTDDDDTGEFGEEDADESDDDELDDLGDDTDETPKKKKKPNFAKAIDEYRAKAINAYWEDVKRTAVIGDAPVVKSAVATLTAIRDDKSVPRARRIAAKAEVKSLSALLVTKEAKPVVAASEEDEWDGFFAELNGTVN